MKLHLFCSPEYKPMADAFVYPVASKEFEIVEHYYDKSGTLFRMNLIGELLNGKDIFFFTGCDVLFIKPCIERGLELLGDSNIAAQGDSQGEINTDFMIFRPSTATRQFWAEATKIYHTFTLLEQGACNQLIRNGMIDCVKLPMNEFFNCCACKALNGIHKEGWMPGDGDIPESARIVHAACVLPGEKTNVLNKVKELIHL